MKYDTVVIGAGSAGSIVATRLSEDPKRAVLLLEAGPDYPNFEHLPEELKYGYATGADIMTSDHNWQFTGKSTDTAGPLLVPRGKVTGGSSAINGQVFLRGIPEDYEAWAAMGNNQWTFQEMLPYFRKIESDTEFGTEALHNGDGPIIVRRFAQSEWLADQTAFYQACRAAGFDDSPDHNDPYASGVGPVPLNNPNGIRWSTALGYLNRARHRLNLTIKPNCTVHRLRFDGRRATGVEVESGGEHFVVESDEIVLSGGAIGSPHILMLSGIGPADHLREMGVTPVHDLPGVGQNLRDHPIIYLAFKTQDAHPLDGFAPRLQVALRYTAEGSHLRNDLQVLMQSFATQRIDRGGDRMVPLGIGMIAVLNLAVGSGEMRLASTDPNIQPFLDYNYLQDEFDRRRLREVVRLCVRLSEHDSFREIIASRITPTEADLASDDALDAYLLREGMSGQHISGTCKMAPASDPLAVVDQFGRVHGTDGLRVADASIMPDCIRANTNVTTMVIGERIADFIRQGV